MVFATSKMDCFIAFMAIFLSINTVTSQVNILDYLADNLQVNYTVLDNLNNGETLQFSGRIGLTNTGDSGVTNNTWEIYFCSIRLMEPNILSNKSNDGGKLGNSKIKVYHLTGCLHKLKPMEEFEGFAPQQKVELPFRASDWSISRTDVMPRWYVTEGGDESRTIVSTASETLEFVSDFLTPEQYKRTNEDQYDPPTPEYRFENTVGTDSGMATKLVIPTPVYEDIVPDSHVDITINWLVVYSSVDVMKEAVFLAEKIGTAAVDIENKPSSRYIQLNIGKVNGSMQYSSEAYELKVTADTSVINITGISSAGTFYGVHTLLSLATNPSGVPECEIIDYPRFTYRGMHLDNSRNFVTKEEVMKLIDVMAMYKLNTFHFHFTDDEGWRLEIPGIKEATEVGGKRCFDLDEDTCILSQLGSGPSNFTSGSGFYTVNEYMEILQYANDRHVRVIPEFDMPGHGHAIIKAMEARFKRYMNTDPTKATEYLLSDPSDDSEYQSAQIFTDNAINPCMNSTYNFIRYLVQQIKFMHQSIQPLTVFNFGGDEVPDGAWEKSPICKRFLSSRPDLNQTKIELLRYFSTRVAEIAHSEGLDIAAWEDGLGHLNQPYDRESIPNTNAYIYAWSNVWEWGHGEKAYIFANNDYKVILSHVTHLYFDHPYEPDPEERGYYWGTRYTDTYKTFGYKPDDVYSNIDVTRMGAPIDKLVYCEPSDRCIPLNDTKRANILGIQGHLWSETSRTPGQLEYMIFPRLLALAERAWHKADWEDSLDKVEMDLDWEQFANSLGYRELSRLAEIGIQYRIPPPGARIQETDGVLRLEANVKFPGLHILYSTNAKHTWTTYKDPVDVTHNTQVYLQTRSADGSRHSRTVMFETGGNTSSAYLISQTWVVLLFSIVCYYLYL